MARKAESGIDYFPMNSDIIHNPKIKLVVAEFGSKLTWAVLLPLYCKIYREKGYWIDWFDEDSKLLFAQDECKVELSVVNELVAGCVRRSLFNKEVFDLFGVLTSDRIQENYLIAKSRNKEVDFIEEFALKNQKGEYVYNSFKNVNIIALNVNIIAKKVNIGTQNKKEKKIIEGDGEGEGKKQPTHSPDDKKLFKNLLSWIDLNAPRVNKLNKPLDIDEYLSLRKIMDRKELTDLLVSMHNYKPLLTKNISAYLTILRWRKKDLEINDPQPNQSKKLAEAVKAIENANH